MAISLEQFQSQIVASELMKQEDVAAFIAAFPDDRRPTSAEDLARELVRQKRLTKYQAEQVYAGKGKMLVLGNYVVLDKLGQGGMGVVLKAEHKRLKRPVALKVMSPSVVKTPDALKRFHREVEAAAKLRHPNVVATDDADEAKGTHFLVMEYVEGSDLSVLVKKNGPLSVDQAVQCILEAARGLEFAHGQGVVHRDIKPANLLLDKSGVVKILDMGLARIEGDSGSQAELTSTGAVMGTVDYMAPEQALSTKDADARSDIYSLGISLWYLLTARCAFEGDSLMAKLLAHRESAIPSLRKANAEVPEAVDAVFRKMVAKQRSDRYQTMTDVIRDLEAYVNGTSSSPVHVSMPEISEDLNLQSFLSQMGGPGGAAATSTKQKTVPSPGRVAPNSEATSLLGGTSVDTDPQTMATIQSQTRRNTQPTKQSRKSTTAPPWFRNVRVLAAAGGAALIMLFAAVFFLRTPHGTLRVEILDPEVELKIEGTELTFRDGRNEPVSLTTGEKRLIVSRGDLSFETDTFTLKKGQEILVRVELIEDKLVALSNEEVIGEKSIGRSLVTASTTGQKGTNAAIVKPQPKTESATTTRIPETGLRFSPGDVVELPMASSPDKADCTLEMWLTPASDIEPTGYSSLFDVSRGGLILENYRFRFYTFHGHAQSEPTLQPGQRIHVAGVNNGKRRLLYLNGQLIATSPDAGHPNPDTAPSPQRIGGSSFDACCTHLKCCTIFRAF
jgi:eukaryotic-like serine/threonine-protein kinase